MRAWRRRLRGAGDVRKQRCSRPMLSHATFVTWAAGRKDAMGLPFSDWLLAVDGPDGRALRDADNRVVYETQAQWMARQAAPIAAPIRPGQQELFA